jgi:rubredoxin
MTRRGWATPLDESFGVVRESNEYLCPVCGIELSQSNFETPAKHYYCPSCSTRQRPSLVVPREQPPVLSLL